MTAVTKKTLSPLRVKAVGDADSRDAIFRALDSSEEIAVRISWIQNSKRKRSASGGNNGVEPYQIVNQIRF